MRYAWFWTEPSIDRTWVVCRQFDDAKVQIEFISIGHQTRDAAEAWLDAYYNANVRPDL